MAIAKTATNTAVWKFLIKNGFTKAGAAGMMGNMQAESGIIPNRVEILCLRRLAEAGYGNYTDASYTQAVDSGRISKASFLNPLPGKQYGYGLCQWTSPGRKSNYYEHMKSKGKSIGDLESALEFLINELKSGYSGVYKVLTTTGSVQEASDKVLKDFEIPSNWQSHSKTRASYSWEFYNMFVNEPTDSQETKKEEAKKEQTKKTVQLMDWTPYKGKISNSGGDERGRATGGQAGDQTGNEWCIKGWYNRPWDCVLRYPNTEIGQWIALLGIEAANNNLIGYDQNQRYTYWEHLKASGYRPSKITVACEADCSAGVIANVRAVGYLKNIPAFKNINATYTGNMRSGFKAAGFQVLTGSKYVNGTEYLLPGDILLNDVHHTATNLGIGNLSGGIDQTIPDTPSGGGVNPIEDAQKLDKSIAGTYTTTAGVNLRTGAGTNKSIILTVPKGGKVNNYGYYTPVGDVKWYYVIYNGHKGFIHSGYLAGAVKPTPQPTPTPSPTPSPTGSSDSGRAPSETPKWVGKVTASELNVRKWAGTQNAKIKSYPILKKGNLVDVCDTIKAKDGSDWYFVRIAGKIFGFVSAKYIQRV